MDRYEDASRPRGRRPSAVRDHSASPGARNDRPPALRGRVFSYFGCPEDVETLPISLSSKQVADYSAASDARFRRGRGVIAEVIHDADPDANVRARYSQVLDNLLTPVPGGPPKPTVTPSPSPIPAPASVYVTNIRLEPAEPKQNEPITFYVTFSTPRGLSRRTDGLCSSTTKDKPNPSDRLRQIVSD